MAKEREEALYVISIAARLAGIHPQTLRIYERKRLVSPRRTPGDTRLYSNRDIERLKYIQELTRECGINLAGVRMIIELHEEMERLKEILDETEKRFNEAQKGMEEEIERVKRSFRKEIALFPRGKLMPR